MKVLVTGGGGFLGSALCRRLAARGDEVRSFSRGSYPELEALGIDAVRGDLADAAAVSRAAAGRDLVFHVGAKAGVWGPYEAYYKANVEGTRSVIEACRKHGIRRLVYTSSPSVVFGRKDIEGGDESLPYPETYDAPYPETKALAEKLVMSADGGRLATVSLRPHLIWGPGDNHLIPRIIAKRKAGQLRRIGGKPKLIDTVFIENAVDAHLLAAERLAPGAPLAGKAYFISNGEPVPVWQLVDRILGAAGLPPVSGTVPPWAALAAGAAFEAFHRLLGLPGEPRMTRFTARELSTAHWFDIGAARRDLGYEPKVSIEEGLRRLKVHFRSEAPARGKRTPPA